MKYAIGFIETRGFIGLVHAADTMVKAADVTILGTKRTGGGFMAVAVEGDVAAVKVAVVEGALAAKKIGELISVHVIPSPHAEVDKILPGRISNSK